MISLKLKINAFIIFKIFIKKGTRSSRKHLDSARNIKEDHYRLIKIAKESPKIHEIVELLN